MRLPRDWLGPRDELVPVGPAAGPVPLFGDDSLPPTADAFWSEDSAALHDALQAPLAHQVSQGGAPALEPARPPSARGARRSLTRRLSIPRLPATRLRPSRRWALLTLPIGALLVLALLGSTLKPTSPPAKRPSASATAQRQAVPRDAAASLGLNARAKHSPGPRTVTDVRRRHRDDAAPAAARTRRARLREIRRTHPPVHGSGSSSAEPTSPSPSQPSSAYVAAPTGDSATSNGDSSSSGAAPSPGTGSTASPPVNHTATSASNAPFGENGTLGPGSSPDS